MHLGEFIIFAFDPNPFYCSVFSFMLLPCILKISQLWPFKSVNRTVGFLHIRKRALCICSIVFMLIRNINLSR